MLLEEGAQIPSLESPDQNGENHALKDLLGSAGAVFYFYPKDNTPGCTTEGLDFQANLATFQALGVTVVGVSKDSVKSHANFCAKKGFDFTLLSDESLELCKAFGVWQEKKNYGKTYMGIVRTTFLVNGAGQVVKVYPKVRVKEHVEKVLQEARNQQA